jgi:hypothetical protein
MSQVGIVLSVGSQNWAGVGTNDGSNWIVLYQYNLDQGGTQQAEVLVGSGMHAAVALWASPAGTITVPNPPGTTNLPITLPCPPLIAAAAFGVPLK